MKNPALRSSLFLVLLFCGSLALAANRPISQKWDVRNGPNRRMAIQWFAGESVAFDLQPVNGRTPLDLSGATVIWEITDWTGLTNAYLSATGTVSGATASWVLTPDQTNLPEGTYNGYARAVTGSDERVVLAWQTVKVLWSPSSDNYALVLPQPLNYTKAEIDAMLGQLNETNSAALFSTSNSLSVAISTNAFDIAELQARPVSDTNLSLRVDGIEGVTNDWNAAFGWGDHALPGYLMSYTEIDPIWNAQSGAVYSAIAVKQDATTAATDAELSATSNVLAVATSLKFDTANTNAFATAAQGDLAEAALTQATADGRYVQPQVASDYLTLDSEISSWDDIGLTYTNALRLNAAVTITNDSAWSGWTTDGSLSGGVILLMAGEYLLSPVQSNGIARVDYESWSHMAGTSVDVTIHTNSVEAADHPPYHAGDGQVRMDASFFAPPGTTPGLYITNVTITAYSDLTEAATEKVVAHLQLIDDPVDPSDVVSKRYVDAEDATERDYAAYQLTAYAADPDKTVRGSELRLGNMWVVSPADASGDRFIVSGGEISGDGELVGTTTEFVVSKNGYPLLSFQSDSSGLYITNHTISATSSNVTVNLGIATNGVTSAPYAEWTENLVVGEWERVLTYDTETYPTQTDGYYTLEFTVAATNSGYFRAMQDEGDSVMTVKADELNLGAAHLVFNSVSNTTTYAATLSWDATNKVFIVTEEAL